MAATIAQLILRPLEIATITALAFTSGLSFCLSTWVIPNALLAPPSTMIRQFLATVARGERYLQPGSRILGLCLLTITYLTAHHPDPVIAGGWQGWAICLAVLIPIAPYEVWVIFPINDEVKAIDRQMEKQTQQEHPKKLSSLLRQWQILNFGRILPPLLVALAGLYIITSN